MRVAVTGAHGKLGRSVVRALVDAGHEVTALDRVPPPPGAAASGIMLELTDAGQVLDAMAGIDEHHGGLDAIVHLGAIPAPGRVSDVATFQNNMLSTFNVLNAARKLGIRRIVTASSETLLGIPFDTPPPYIPVDEEYPARPETTYSMVKHLEEQLAIQLVRWDPSLSIAALRFSNVMDPEDYAAFPSYDADPMLRKWNLWGYIDGRDGAQAVVRALDANRPGFEAYIIAAADTVMSRPNAELVAAVFPDVPVTRDLDEHDTMLSIDKARRLLGYEPQHSWRDA